MMPSISVSGRGGQPGTYTSTGNELVDALDRRVGVEHAARARAGAHADHPLRLGHLLVDVLEHRHHFDRHPAGDDHQVACRGLKRIASAPNRARSYRLDAVAISSIPQHAVANGIGHTLDRRAQLTTF